MTPHPATAKPKRRQAYLCTFPVDHIVEGSDEPNETRECGRIARATYRRIDLKLPTGDETYDRCARHDTAKVQADAERQGFTRTELTQ